MSIIGISGKIGSGKDTVALMIQFLAMGAADPNTWGETSDYGFKEFMERGQSRLCGYWQIKRFAGKLKQIVSLLTGIPVEDLEKQEVKDRVLGEEWWTFWNPVKFGTPNIIQYHPDAVEAVGGPGYIQKTTVRQLLQQLGTNAMRDRVHPNIHVNALFADYIPSVYWMCDRCDSDNLPELIEVPSRFPDYPENEWVCPKCKGAESEGDITQVITDALSNWLLSDMRFPNELEGVESRGGITIRVNRHDLFRLGYIDTNIQPHPSETALDGAVFGYTINNDGSLEDLLEQVRQILLTEKII
jgi:hypothetical protein